MHLLRKLIKNDNGFESVEYKRSIQFEYHKKLIFGRFLSFKVIIVTVYMIEHFIAELKHNQSRVFKNHEDELIIQFNRDKNPILRYENNKIYVLNSLLLLEAEYLRNKLTDSSLEFGTSAIVINGFDTKLTKHHKKQTIQVYDFLKYCEVYALKLIDCISVDCLIYIKDICNFREIGAHGSNFKYLKNIPKFYKSKYVKIIILKNIMFESKYLEVSFFRCCEDLDNLTKFQIEDLGKPSQLFDFTGAIQPRKNFIRHDDAQNLRIKCRVYGIFQTKKKMFNMIYSRSLITNRSSLVYLNQLLRNLNVMLFKIKMVNFSSPEEIQLFSGYLQFSKECMQLFLQELLI